MADLLKDKFNEEVAKAKLENAGFMDGKKFAGMAMLTWIVIRIAEVTMVYIADGKYDLGVSPVSIIYIPVAILFAFAIVNGARSLAYLPILGGVVSLILCFTNDYIILIKISFKVHTEFYGITLIFEFITCAAQILIMLLILLNKKYKLYSKQITEINKKLREVSKTNISAK